MFKSVKAKTLISLTDQGVVSGTNFLLSILVARLCGADQYGLFNVCVGFVATMSVLQGSLILLPYVVYRNRLSEGERRIAINESLKQFIYLLLISLLFCAVYILFFAKNVNTQPEIFIFSFLFYVVGFHFREFCRGICVGDSNYLINLLLDVAATLALFSTLLAVFLYYEVTVSVIFMAIAAAYLCGVIIWFGVYRPPISFSFGLNRNAIFENWQLGKWILAGNTPLMINLYINIWLIAAVLGPREAGIFAACNALNMFVNPGITAYYNVILPLASKIFVQEGKVHLFKMLLKSTKLLGLALSAFSALIWVIGGWLITRIYGLEFTGQEVTVSLLALAILVRSVGMPPQIGLLVVERAELNALVNLLTLIANLVMSTILVLEMGIVGAAIAVVLSEVVAALARWLTLNSLMRPRNLEQIES